MSLSPNSNINGKDVICEDQDTSLAFLYVYKRVGGWLDKQMDRQRFVCVCMYVKCVCVCVCVSPSQNIFIFFYEEYFLVLTSLLRCSLHITKSPTSVCHLMISDKGFLSCTHG